ncbi:MAG: carboxypeptidase regulatory-like domain-containing protein [Bacteroidota bacterium]
MHTLSRFLLPCTLLLGVLVAGCDSTDESGTATISGRVTDSSGSAIGGANVVAAEFGASTVTDGSGNYALDLQVDSSGTVIALGVFADDFVEASPRSVTVFIDQVTPVPSIVLTRLGGNSEDDGGNDGGGGDTGGGVDDGADEGSGPGASITLVDRSSTTIAVRSAGADETATLTFVVLDAFGNPVDTDNAITVNFAIASGPGGGEFLAPASDETNASGRVQTTLSSGTVAGTVQIRATATNSDGVEIASLPVIITITGGLPDQAHFGIGIAERNVPGYEVLNVSRTVEAVVGDIYANPVQPGTAVYFTTSTGIIEGAAQTNALGQASVTLLSAPPFNAGTPPAACPDADPRGYGVITASTADMNQEQIETNGLILFSAETTIDLVTEGLELQGYRYTVSDLFGHPLAPGSVITVAADGVNVEAVGDVNVVLGDYLCPGSGTTRFTFAVVQGDEEGEDDLPLPPEVETITISVSSPNGNLQLTRSPLGEGLTQDLVTEDF